MYVEGHKTSNYNDEEISLRLWRGHHGFEEWAISCHHHYAVPDQRAPGRT